MYRAYLELTKPRLTLLVLVTTGVGFLLASRGAFRPDAFFWTLLGTWLVAAGSQTLNQYLERDMDAAMERTRSRPLPSGRLAPYRALRFGVILAGAGLVVLSGAVNPLSGWVAFVTLVSYLFAYTPLKTRSALCTVVGAVPGALPPVIGWAGARGALEAGAWSLFAILFVWQIPHFLAISWMYREEYRRAGFRMLSADDADGRLTRLQVIVWTLSLLPVSLMPVLLGLSGPVYFAGAVLLWAVFLRADLRLLRWMNTASARVVFLTSVAYLPLLLTFMVLDRGA